MASTSRRDGQVHVLTKIRRSTNSTSTLPASIPSMPPSPPAGGEGLLEGFRIRARSPAWSQPPRHSGQGSISMPSMTTGDRREKSRGQTSAGAAAFPAVMAERAIASRSAVCCVPLQPASPCRYWVGPWPARGDVPRGACRPARAWGPARCAPGGSSLLRTPRPAPFPGGVRPWHGSPQG